MCMLASGLVSVVLEHLQYVSLIISLRVTLSRLQKHLKLLEPQRLLVFAAVAVKFLMQLQRSKENTVVSHYSEVWEIT